MGMGMNTYVAENNHPNSHQTTKMCEKCILLYEVLFPTRRGKRNAHCDTVNSFGINGIKPRQSIKKIKA